MCPPSSFPPSSSHPNTDVSTAIPPDMVPTSPMSLSAYHHVQHRLPPAIFNHSLRVYLYARAFAHHAHSPWVAPDRLPILFAACVFHDMGCATENDGPERFEVCGADAAVQHLRRFGGEVDGAEDVHQVWTAIALHTSSGIAERIAPLARFLRLAVLADFNRLGKTPWITEAEVELIGVGYQRDIEEQLPRLSAEKALGDVVVDQGLRQPSKAPPSSWVGNMVRAAKEEPEWKGVNRAF